MGPLRVVAGDLPPCGTKSKASETTWSADVRLRGHERKGKTTPARITTARQVPLAGPGARHIAGVTLDVNAGRSARLSA